MRTAESYNLGEYQAVPFAEGWGDTDWRAGVLLSGGDDARGDRPAKSLYPQLFASEEAALAYARDECERQATQLSTW